MRACERKGASDLLRAREMCAAGARYGAVRPEMHEDDGAPDTARRGGRCMRHADEWTYAAEGAPQGAYRQQRVPSRAPNGGPETAEILA